MERWLKKSTSKKSIEEGASVCSSNRPSTTTEPLPGTSSEVQSNNNIEEGASVSLSNRPSTTTEPLPGTSSELQSSNHKQKHSHLDISLDIAIEDVNETAFDCTEDEEERYSTENEKKKQTKRQKSTVKGVKKTFKKKFMHDWLKLPEFKGWLLKGNSDEDAICKVCNVVMKAGKSELKKHGTGKVHTKNMDFEALSNTSQPSITTFVSENTKLKNTEAAICSYIVENNLPISSVEPLVELIKSLPEKSILSQISLGKQKATNVIRNGLRPFFNQELVSELKQHLFSIYIDETTDVSVKKQLAILVSYCHNFETKVDVIDVVDCPDGTAIALYTQLINTLKENNIPLQNWIGFCADTTAVMMGQHNSVSKLIRTHYPQVFVSKCACHMIHLVASYACTKLSSSLEDLCRNVYNHFGRSPKNAATYKDFQAFYEVKPHKMLRACQTRWLSLQACVRRILEQWDSLTPYWRILNFEDPTHANRHTLKTLENPLIKCQMHFVDYSLGLFNDFNCMFQADYPQFSELKTQTEELIKTLALNFMNRNYVKRTPANQINPCQNEEHLDLKHIYLGVEATNLLSELENKEQSEVQKIFESAKLFYIESIVQIQKRFVFEDVHNDSSFLNPKNANDLTPTSLYAIAKKYIPSHIAVDFTELDKEWRNQSLLSDMDTFNSTDTVGYWKNIFEKKFVESGRKFVQLPILVNYFMSLPFSNAAVERLFSAVKNIKTDKRNRLENETMGSILCVKYGLRRTGKTSVQLMKNQLVIPHLKFVQAHATTSEARKIRLNMNKSDE